MFATGFKPFVMEGDFVTCTVGGIDYTARLEADEDSHPHDSECYTPEQILAWSNDEWRYFGVVVSASKNGVALGDLGAVWGIEGNFPIPDPNGYFQVVANELLTEAQAGAAAEIQRIKNALEA